ncbi:MAG TPA: ABC transporter substrate-binding protein [Candidatus Deferrimicrobiaceae bacterium]|nr:ABC transporter substrate-binding protein [Candidatus Deferrimicrobiaceae bacterium]
MTVGFRPGRWLAAILLLSVCAAEAHGLTDAEKRGRRIYMEGRGRKKISAVLAESGFRAPGSGFPCVNCHLAGGTGQFEGGVRSADITWFNLTKEFRGARLSGRAHPAYDDESVMTAVTNGRDPAGNALSPAHPRYEMERDDLEDLVAYLKIMDREPVPGVTDDSVKIGILLPETGPLAAAGREVRDLLGGYFAEVNAMRGIYNRRLDLVPLPFDPSEDDGPLKAVRKAVESGDVFCFLANVGVGPEDGAVRYLSDNRVPVLVPLLSAPVSGYGTGRYTFHVFASIRDQARVLVDFLAEKTKASGIRPGILFAEDGSGRAGAMGAKEQARKHDLSAAVEVSFSPSSFSAADVANRLEGERVDAVLYFGGPREALAFAQEAERRSWRPLFLAPAPMVGNALMSAPAGFLRSAYLASPLGIADPSSKKMAGFVRLEEKYGADRKHRAFRYMAYSGAVLLEEGLKRSGRGVTREKFVESIGNVWKLETGVTPPLTYSPNQRVGALGAAILKVDPETRELVPDAAWREPE